MPWLNANLLYLRIYLWFFPESSGASEGESEEDLSGSRSSLPRHGISSAITLHRGNTTAHVCWHRNTSVSMLDFSTATEVPVLHLHDHQCQIIIFINLTVSLQNKLSGNLLRKFKNSNGWQKLWVVFTNFTLFFYKTHEVKRQHTPTLMYSVNVCEIPGLTLTSLRQDEFPLASLPLLGYTITDAGESENIHKDHVFKLHFKSHVYYFRTESEYFFKRYSKIHYFTEKKNLNMLLLVW